MYKKPSDNAAEGTDSRCEKDSVNEEVVNSLIEHLKDSIDIGDNNATKSELSCDKGLDDTQKIEKNTSCKKSDLPPFIKKNKSLSDSDEQNIRNNDDSDDDDVDLMYLEARDMDLDNEGKMILLEKSQAHKNDGNKEYQKGNYKDSLHFYTKALRTCPIMFYDERSIMYCNRAASKAKLELTIPAVTDCTKALQLNSNYVKAYMRRASLYEKCDKLEEALEDYDKILELDRTNSVAIEAKQKLPTQIAERNEKLKEDMLGKLKDMGNTLLRPFGLSTNNFELTQDPSTGSYSVNFRQAN